jgi:hypothetical protein
MTVPNQLVMFATPRFAVLATNGQETHSLLALVALTLWQLLMALLVTVVKPNIVPYTNTIDITCRWARRVPRAAAAEVAVGAGCSSHPSQRACPAQLTACCWQRTPPLPPPTHCPHPRLQLDRLCELPADHPGQVRQNIAQCRFLHPSQPRQLGILKSSSNATHAPAAGLGGSPHCAEPVVHCYPDFFVRVQPRSQRH